MLVLAKSKKGAEFMYAAASAHSVSKASAEKIMEALNKAAYMLRDGETWALHEVWPPYDAAAIYAEGQAFKIRKGRIYRRAHY